MDIYPKYHCQLSLSCHFPSRVCAGIASAVQNRVRCPVRRVSTLQVKLICLRLHYQPRQPYRDESIPSLCLVNWAPNLHLPYFHEVRYDDPPSQQILSGHTFSRWSRPQFNAFGVQSGRQRLQCGQRSRILIRSQAIFLAVADANFKNCLATAVGHSRFELFLQQFELIIGRANQCRLITNAGIIDAAIRLHVAFKSKSYLFANWRYSLSLKYTNGIDEYRFIDDQIECRLWNSPAPHTQLHSIPVHSFISTSSRMQLIQKNEKRMHEKLRKRCLPIKNDINCV